MILIPNQSINAGDINKTWLTLGNGTKFESQEWD